MDTRLGRYHVAEPLATLTTLHRHDGRALTTVDHEPPMAVLDQEDLIAQGIDTSALVPGAKKVAALGSCVFNASTVHLSGVLGESRFATLTGAHSDPYRDTKAAEEYAIRLYHATTDLTGDPSSEWPPTDCGSSGIYVCKELQAQGVIGSYKTAVDPTDLVSLLQSQSVIVGSPWFQAWFDPDRHGFVDGDGSRDALEAAIRSGVAGGHETCISAVEKLALTPAGLVEPAKTVLRVRNSWTASWGDHGSYRIHLSTWAALAHVVDYRQMQP